MRGMWSLGMSLAVLMTVGNGVAATSVPKVGGAGYFLVGREKMSIGNLNDRLGAAGYPRLSDQGIVFGGGGHGYIGQALVGAEGGVVLVKKRTSAGFKTRLAAGYAVFNVGYAAYAGGGLCVYPLVGIGGGGMLLDIVPTTGPAFNDILVHPAQKTQLTVPFYVIQAAIGADYVFPFGENEQKPRGPVVGVRLGYLYTPRSDNWRMGEPVRGGPTTAITGPFVRVMIGGGGVNYR